jgi:serine/threonine-protein kinase haspin
MPAKQVYGRKPAKTVATAGYTKFLSPDKDDVPQTKSTNKTRAKKQQQSESAINQIETGFKALNVESANDAEDGLPSRSLPEIDRKDERRHTEFQATGRDLLEQQLENLTLHHESATDAKEVQKKPGRPRKALSHRDQNAETKSKIARPQGKPRKGLGDNETKNKHAGTKNDPIEIEPCTKKQSSDRERHQSETAGRRGGIIHAQSTEHPNSPPAPPDKAAPSTRPNKPPQPQPMAYSEDIHTSYVQPLLALSSQRTILTFGEWSDALKSCFDVQKIAEASFSEVYRLTIKGSKSGRENESVLKVVALKTAPGEPLPFQDTGRSRRGTVAPQQSQIEREELEKRQDQDQWKSSVDDVHCEVKLLQNLNHIPGFTQFRELTVLQGRPSQTFTNAWKSWNKARPRDKKSEFPDPSKKTSYSDTQLWAVIEMQDAGTDCGKVMEAGGITSVWEVWDIFWGVCLSVAKAEEACRFEHRDMHMDNICIRPSAPETDLLEPRIKKPLKRKFGFTGLETTVIDYTLSRADIIIPTLCTSRRASLASHISLDSSMSEDSEPEVAYLDLNKDQSLFSGDASEEYQYEIYRYMRDVAFHNDPLAQHPSTGDNAFDSPRRSPRKLNEASIQPSPRRSPRKSIKPHHPPKDIWKQFHPKTNLIWTHFILHKLLTNPQYTPPSSLSETEIMWNVDASVEDAARIHSKAGKMHRILQKVERRLEPEALGKEGCLGSVKELVVVALECGWLRAGDVSGEGV